MFYFQKKKPMPLNNREKEILEEEDIIPLLRSAAHANKDMVSAEISMNTLDGMKVWERFYNRSEVIAAMKIYHLLSPLIEDIYDPY